MMKCINCGANEHDPEKEGGIYCADCGFKVRELKINECVRHEVDGRTFIISRVN